MVWSHIKCDIFHAILVWCILEDLHSGVFKYKQKWILFRVVYSNINKCICMCAWFLTYDQDAWLSTIGGVFSPKWDSKKPHSNIRNIETLFFISIFKRRNVFFHLLQYYRESLSVLAYLKPANILFVVGR